MSVGQERLGFQRWRSLLFLHWGVPVAELRALVPPVFELDLHRGRAYVGLVAFAMEDVRPLRGLPPVPTAARFPEVNVRTYVRHRGQAGVYFFSLDAGSTLAVLGARAVWALPYFRAHMRVERTGHEIHYWSRRLWPRPRPATLDVRYTPGPPLPPAQEGSLEHFLVERYTLFTTRGSAVIAARVHHTPYPLRRVTVEELDQTLLAAARVARPDDGERPPDLFSDGVDVEVGAPERRPA